MASYKPPSENLPIFDSTLFDNANTTIPDVSDTYLTFPVAQGAETLKDTTVDGDLTVFGKTTIADLELENIDCQTISFTNTESSGEISGYFIINQSATSGMPNTMNGINTNEIDAEIITVGTLNYTSLNPPIAGAQNLAETLTIGNDASQQAIKNCGAITITDGALTLQDENPIGFDTRTIIEMNNLADTMYIVHGDSQGIDNARFTIGNAETNYITFLNNPSNYTTISCSELLRNDTSNDVASATGFIMDTLNHPPMYKQIFYNISSSNPLSLTSSVPTFIFKSDIYPASANRVFNYGINYAEILFSYFQINFTSATPWVGNNNCQLFLSNAPNPPSYDPTKGNAILFNVVNNSSGQANYTFTSSVPIILYYQNGDLGTQFENLYFNIQIQDTGVYTVALQSCNFAITAYVAGKNTGSLVFGN